MSKREQEYDPATKTLRIFRSFGKPKTLVPNDELKESIDALKKGQTSDGEPLSKIEYVFESEETAEYNHQPLSFAGVQTRVGSRGKHSPYTPSDGEPSFTTREDFGIE